MIFLRQIIQTPGNNNMVASKNKKNNYGAFDAKTRCGTMMVII